MRRVPSQSGRQRSGRRNLGVASDTDESRHVTERVQLLGESVAKVGEITFAPTIIWMVTAPDATARTLRDGVGLGARSRILAINRRFWLSRSGEEMSKLRTGADRRREPFAVPDHLRVEGKEAFLDHPL